jgi:F-type H+-transporting ATPase subunit a
VSTENNLKTEELHNTPQIKSEEVSHEATLFAEPISGLHVGGLTITNSLISSWITVAILVIFLMGAGRKIKKVPSGMQHLFEILLEEALKLADSVTGDRKKSKKFLPITMTLFLFILVNNWLGLLPGVGTIGFIEEEGVHKVFVPLLRGGTADLNTTLALALFAVVGSHVFGVLMVGSWKHLNKFLNFEAFLAIPQKIKNDVSVILVNPIKAFVGIVEIIGEIAKVASLSFRLFGNIFAGEVLLASMMAIFAYVLPLPFMFMEIIVGLIQALIFAMLTMVFMTIATSSEEH